MNFLYRGNLEGTTVYHIQQKKLLHLKCNVFQFEEGITEYKKGKLIQNAFDFLSDDEREFLLTGLTCKEWDELFPPEEE